MHTTTRSHDLSQLLTIREAADETGKTTAAIARRVERGTLRSVKGHDGKRRVMRTELIRHGLLPIPGGTTLHDDSPETVGETGQLQHRHGSHVAPGLDVAKLVDRVIAAEIKLESTRQLQEHSESQLQAERKRAHDLEQQVVQLRIELGIAQHRRRWFHRKPKNPSPDNGDRA